MKIELKSRIFESSKDMKFWVKRIRDNHPLLQPIPLEEGRVLTEMLMEFHPHAYSKVGVGIKFWFVRRMQPPVEGYCQWYRCLHIMRWDDTAVDVGLESLTTRLRSAVGYHRRNVLGVLRKWVMPPASGAGEWHHVGYAFKDIASNFFQEHGIDMDRLVLVDDGAGDEIDDPALKEAWIAYHDANAHLVLVPHEEHQRLHGKMPDPKAMSWKLDELF